MHEMHVRFVETVFDALKEVKRHFDLLDDQRAAIVVFRFRELLEFRRLPFPEISEDQAEIFLYRIGPDAYAFLERRKFGGLLLADAVSGKFPAVIKTANA